MPKQELIAYFTSARADFPHPPSDLHIHDDCVFGIYRNLRLSSVFQPLCTTAGLIPVAHEALLRVQDSDGNVISPTAAFSLPKSKDEAVYFDRLCRIVHALNFVRQSDASGELFLNVSGRHLLGVSNREHGETFERLLRDCGLRPEQIILEILEARVDDIDLLNEAVSAYRQRGYRVAIDDFGCEHSNFDRLWRLTPDIVKLDRSLIVQGTTNERARRILPKLVEIIHELGAQVVCEGIENIAQHQLAIDAGADLVQGYRYGRPSPLLARRTKALELAEIT